MKECNPSNKSLALKLPLVLLLIINVLANMWKRHTVAKISKTAEIGMSRNSVMFLICSVVHASPNDIAEPLPDESNTLPCSLTSKLSAASRPWWRVSNNPREGVSISRNESTLCVWMQYESIL